MANKNSTQARSKSIHLSLPREMVSSLDWLVKYQNSDSTRFPKITRSDLLRTEIAMLVKKADEIRDRDHAEAVAATKKREAKKTKTKASSTQAAAPKSRKNASK